jgi:hypothetical protein
MSTEIRTCVECGHKFTWSYGQQRYFKEHNLQPPKHCKDCLGQRKRELDQGMRSEVGPLFGFPTPGDRPAAPTEVPRPPVRPPQVPLSQRSSRPQEPPLSAWWKQLDALSTIAFIWLILVLITYKLVGWPAAVGEGILGIALYLWISSQR